MNIVPITEPDTLPIIYDRGLIGMYHDWCEPHSTYPRTYDLLHANHIISSTKNRYLSVSSLPSILHSVCYFSYGFIMCYWWSLVEHSFHSAYLSIFFLLCVTDETTKHHHCRCNVTSLIMEMDRILRPNGWAIFHDHMEVLSNVQEILRSLHWDIILTYKKNDEQLLAAQKTFWRPDASS